MQGQTKSHAPVYFRKNKHKSDTIQINSKLLWKHSKCENYIDIFRINCIIKYIIVQIRSKLSFAIYLWTPLTHFPLDMVYRHIIWKQRTCPDKLRCITDEGRRKQWQTGESLRQMVCRKKSASSSRHISWCCQASPYSPCSPSGPSLKQSSCRSLTRIKRAIS